MVCGVDVPDCEVTSEAFGWLNRFFLNGSAHSDRDVPCWVFPIFVVFVCFCADSLRCLQSLARLTERICTEDHEAHEEITMDGLPAADVPDCEVPSEAFGRLKCVF
jgi:hypothetical protein